MSDSMPSTGPTVTPSAGPPDSAPPAAPVRRSAALAVLLAALFMDMVDSTIVSIALPHIQRDLGASPAVAQWVLAAYTAALALGLISGGRLGDVHGRRRAFLLGTALFTLASAACGAAGTGTVLVAARAAQGFGAAIMVPQVLAVIVAMYAERERVGAFAWYGLVLSLGNVCGPLLGGVLLYADPFGLSWRAVFYVNIPIGLLTLFAGRRFLPESRAERPLRLDLAGAALLGTATLAVLVPMVTGREAGWPGWLIAVTLLAVPAVALFVVQQQRRDRLDSSALLPPALWGYRSFAVGLLTMFLMFSGLASLFLVLTYELQLGLGWSPLSTALAGVGWPVGIALTSAVARRYAAARPGLLIRGGLIGMAACGAWLLLVLRSAGPELALWQAALPVFAIGLGMGLSVATLTGALVADVPPDHAGAASGAANAVQQLGAAVGIALVGTLYFAFADGSGPPAGGSALWFNVAVFAAAAGTSLLLRRVRGPHSPHRP